MTLAPSTGPTTPAAGARLVTFLGLGKRLPDDTFVYDETEYEWEGKRVATRFVARALAELFGAREVRVLATAKAQGHHREALTESLAELGLEPRFHTIGGGGATAELWEQFQALKETLRAPPDTQVVLDITHGYRSQPFFAAAAVTFVRQVDSVVADHRVVYGAYEGKPPTQVWDLTLFVDLLDWSRALMLFLRTGRAEDVVEPIRRAGKSAGAAWSRSKAGPPPRLEALARALERFGDDLVAVRTGALLLGKAGSGSSAASLRDELAGNREAVARTLPPLADVLERVEAMVQPLVTDSLQGEEGEKALAALARLYLDMGRYAEAAAVAREAWVTRCGTSAAACPGQPSYSRIERASAEAEWFVQAGKVALNVSRVRNDIEHAGFQPSAAKAKSLKDSISQVVSGLESTAGAGPSQGSAAPEESSAERSIFLNVSNHPSSSWSEEQQRAAKRFGGTIVNLGFPAVPPEASPAELEKLAAGALRDVPAETSVAMVMGEYTLTMLLVRELQWRGISCLAATTVREVLEDAEGRKVSSFRFVRFRPYPELAAHRDGAEA